MLDLFIFDMGGVMAQDFQALPAAAHDLGMTYEEMYRAVEPDLVTYMDGAIDTEEFWRRFGARTGIAVKENYWVTKYHPRMDDRMVALVRRLKRHGRVVCGTNTIDVHYAYHVERGEYAAFDTVYASNLMGISKPDPEFWRRILRDEGKDPSVALFVDDLPENIEGARAAGLTAWLFEGYEGLVASLESALGAKLG